MNWSCRTRLRLIVFQLVLSVCLLVSFRNTLLFSSAFAPRHLSSFRGSRLQVAHNDYSKYSHQEVKDMEKLIVSLSKETSDESRRGRVASIFDDALAKPNGAPKRFSVLFDQVLVVVGDRVKLEAEQEALKQQQTVQEQIDREDVPKFKDLLKGRSDIELQLWALVDMMVQSKTIVKKATGELGSEGKFG